MAHGTLLVCECGAELSVGTGTARHLGDWWQTALVGFVDPRTDSAPKIFVYMSQYKQRNPILFSRK